MILTNKYKISYQISLTPITENFLFKYAVKPKNLSTAKTLKPRINKISTNFTLI